MDKRLEDIINHIDDLKMGPNDTFHFHCTSCGKCCTNREDILLTPRDLYNMAKTLEMAPGKLIKLYCECYIGHDSRFPLVRIVPVGSVKRCPLLKNRKCSVHSAKPTVCALFPLGRTMIFKKEDYSPEAVRTAEIQYFLQPIDCGDDTEAFTVKEYLEMFGIPVNDPFFFAWQSFLSSITGYIRAFERDFPKDLMEVLWNTILTAVYLSYDMEEPFMPQFTSNSEKLLKLFEMIKTEGLEGALT